jgi:hypothetical protein
MNICAQFILIGLVSFLFIGMIYTLIIGKRYYINDENILINKNDKKPYLFIRWNFFAINGYANPKRDILLKRLENRGKYYKEASDEFYDDSFLYENVKGEGIRPPEDLLLTSNKN